jgi:hypothetical protein
VNDIYIFLGPTLAVARARAEIDATYLPPVAIGDVYRLWGRRPRVVGIVDGARERVPAVLHKEIMWVMERGVHVFGSADIGALRAVELDMFGMQGVGRIFQDFKDGTLAADDEVAVAYERGPDGYRAISEAMVNIRASLLAARQEKIISVDTCQLLTTIARDFFYSDRNWPGLLIAGKGNGIGPGELDALDRWLPGNKRDQKADDAIAMLRKVRDFHATNPGPLKVSWTTADTAFWSAARQSAETPFESGR